MSPEYSLKVEPEDFLVTEVPLMPVFSERQTASCTHVWLKKRLVSTFDAMGEIAAAANVGASDVSVEGLKDEDGVTQQILSIRKILTEEDISHINSVCARDPKRYVRIERVLGYGSSPVREKRLIGNAFEIIIRRLGEGRARSIKALCDARRCIPMVNYYDGQRFGLPGGPYNSHMIGKALVEGDRTAAAAEIARSGNAPAGASAGSLLGMDPRKLAFFVSSHNSYIWNEAASAEVSKSGGTVSCEIDGGNKICFPISDPWPALPAQLKVPGYEFVDGAARPKDNSRALVVFTDVIADDPVQDESSAGHWKLRLSFFLPTGSYATMLVRQVVSSSHAYDTEA